MDGQLSSGLELLVRIGISKMAARVLVFIAEKGRVRSVEIEDSLNIGQSGVSSAIRELTGRGWIRTEVIPTQTKGRPRHIYQLSVPFSSIVDEVERLGDEEIDNIREGAEDLRRIASACPCY